MQPPRDDDAPPATLSEARWQFWIDRGGTFTDIVARRPDGSLATSKLLSENPEQYRDAALAGVRALLGLSSDAIVSARDVASVKMGTTVATNALLERRGEPTALLVTRGFRDQLRIGYQNRPKLFERHIRLPEPLYADVVEVEERIGARGDVIVPLAEAPLEAALAKLRARNIKSLAIVFMHAWRYPAHERRAAELAERLGFEQISVSHRVSPLIKLVARGHTTIVDAYLSPVLRRYVQAVEHELGRAHEQVPLYFMKSDGGLTSAALFQGKDAILSGPAGGIVGMVRTSLAAGFRKVIGFDMGGTSTDVSHFAGESLADCERELDTSVAGVRVRAPMMAIHTIASGGGSILHFDGQKLRVLADSSGAHPGPRCYRRGGPLSITDCNLLLGKLQPEHFPRLFGPQGDQPLDLEAVQREFARLAEAVTRASGTPWTPERVAEGFLRVAVAKMANAIKFISVQRGYDVSEYTLACFGGAGGQHACLVADELGMQRVYIHPLAGVLSALGMGLASLTAMREQAFERPLGEQTRGDMLRVLAELAAAARSELGAQGVADGDMRVFERVHLKYAGTDVALVVPAGEDTDLRAAFDAAYRARFAFSMPERDLIVETLSVEVVAEASDPPRANDEPDRARAEPSARVRLCTAGTWRDDAPLFRREELARGQTISGPAIISERNATTIVEPGWRAEVMAGNELVLTRYLPRPAANALDGGVDPVALELFNNAFMAIAEQMGTRLANTASSVNIKERLDFSCALFDGAGNLIANAPHMPVHLGSMSESIKTVLRKNAGAMKPGDAYALNDPYNGGTHLPDVTVVLPVFVGATQPAFYVAARGHHADIGGISPGSMPPASRNVTEEGVLLDNVKVLENGQMRSAELLELLARAPYPARNPAQNLADLRAQLAACEKGREELMNLVARHGLATVSEYMQHVQNNAEESVRQAIARLRPGRFERPMDCGATIRVEIRTDLAARSATVDFTGTSALLDDNFNAPPAVVQAAVLYVFRTLVDDDIPMNAGCLRPITVVIPEGSMLSPTPPAATVAGNVETSQCITDALYGALGVLAGSQGTMNNFTFGDERYQYYETVAGGSGAGDGFDGTAAVQTHMTNSRMTDPEIIELRFPVLVEEHSIRTGSGGAGRFRGGDGALRRVRFLEPMQAAILAGSRRFAPHGLAGGQPGELGRTWVERANGAKEPLAYAEQTEMHAGDVFVISTPSGGGYGTSDD